MIADRGFFLYLLIFIGIIAFNLIRQQRANKARQQAMQRYAEQSLPPVSGSEDLSDFQPFEPQARVPDADAAPANGPGGKRLTEAWGRSSATAGGSLTASTARSAAASSPPSATALQMERHGLVHTTRSSHAPFFKSRTDLRHAVATMTVLGPCRALEPFEPQLHRRPDPDPRVSQSASPSPPHKR